MKLNILFITTDQQRRDTLGCTGNPLIQTPRIDRLASEGVRFSRAYCESPICIPSRNTMVTGKKAAHHGATLHNSNMRDGERTLGHVLAENGYTTHFIGKSHFKSQERRGTEESLPDWRDGKYDGWNGPYAGFQTVDLVLGHSNSLVGHYGKWLRENYPDQYYHFKRENMEALDVTCGQGVYRNSIPRELHSSSYVGMRACEFLETMAGRDEPFYCFVSFPDPHWPICPPSPYFEMYDGVEIPENSPFPSDLDTYPRQFARCRAGQPTGYEGGGHYVTNPADVPRITRAYWGAVSFIDVNVGKILDKLDELGMAQDTLVVFTVDHGEYMGAHGLMAKGGFPYEEFINCPLIVRCPGLVPAGRETDALFSFVDFVPTFLDLLDIQEHGLAPDGVSQKNVLTGQVERVRRRLTVTHFSRWDTAIAPDIHSLVTGDWKLNYYAGDPNGELYNLKEDPGERTNLYNRPEVRELQLDLTLQLLDELILVNDKAPHLIAAGVEKGYYRHVMEYAFWKKEFDELERQTGRR